MKLSIIIPAYNIDGYIEKCVNSCLQQDMDSADYEIIIVNDGSTDRSRQVAEDLASRHGNVRVINKENGGLSTARNAGLDAAKGDYIWMIDGDDYIEANCLKLLVGRAYQDDLDVLCFNSKYVYSDGRQCNQHMVCKNIGHIYSGPDFTCNSDIAYSAYIALYRRAFLNSNSLRFLPGILHEDLEFTPRAFCLARRIAYIDEYPYYYVQRQGSITNSKRHARRCRDYLTIADSLHAFTTEHFDKGSATYNAMMKHAYYSLTESLNYYTSSAMPISAFKQSRCYPMDTSITTARARTKARIANFSIHLYIILSRLQNLFDKRY